MVPTKLAYAPTRFKFAILLAFGLWFKLVRFDRACIIGSFHVAHRNEVTDLFDSRARHLASVEASDEIFSGVQKVRCADLIVHTFYIFLPDLGAVFHRLMWNTQLRRMNSAS